ncbi:MAG: hypothetical protein PHE52_00845 [Candidatus Pacebacteria bacterium]|nr:hypothetical protein [Candidatus Paceibacterota bacterium]
MRKILVSITTTRGSDWRAKIKEIRKLGLKEVALFPTCFKKEEREKLYRLLQKAGIKNIPFVHIRNDMAPAELDYLIEKFKAKVFNIHTNTEYPFIYDYSLKHRKMIFIENVYDPFNEKEIRKFGGICLDMTHLEDDRLLHPEKFRYNVGVLERNKIGCNHLSCMQKVLRRDFEDVSWRYDSHVLVKLSQMDYLKKYPRKYFSDTVAIELENTIETQLKVRNYLIKKMGL